MPRHLLAVAVSALGAAGLLTGCGSTAPTTPNGPKVVDITMSPADASSGPASVDVRRGETVELEIHADASGSLLVGSSPAQTVEYRAGTTQVSVGPFTAPGRVAVKRARPTATIVTLRVLR